MIVMIGIVISVSFVVYLAYVISLIPNTRSYRRLQHRTDRSWVQKHGYKDLENGNSFFGQYLTNIKTHEIKLHGKGIKSYSNGGRFDGYWENGSVHGKGIHTFKSGNAFVEK